MHSNFSVKGMGGGYPPPDFGDYAPPPRLAESKTRGGGSHFNYYDLIQSLFSKMLFFKHHHNYLFEQKVIGLLLCHKGVFL